MDTWAPIRKPQRNRPYVVLNTAMSFDGKIRTSGGDTNFSDEEDWQYVHSIRAQVDGIMVGVNTILADDPSLRVKYHTMSKYPSRIVVDSTGRTPLNARVINTESKRYPTIICTTSRLPPEKKRAYEEKGVKILVINPGSQVNVLNMVTTLFIEGIRSILLEGGGSLNWSMLAANCVDEIRLFIAPVVAGGSKAINLVAGEGFPSLSLAPRFQLCAVAQRGDYAILRYGRIEGS